MDNERMDDLGVEPEVSCGLYRTTEPIDDKVSADTLVYFHNHGDPGAGVYPVESWRNNKAVFVKRGILIPADGYEYSLIPLKIEAFYRVVEPFYCCEQRCRLFEKNTLVQLGYKGKGQAILFVPEWSLVGLALPKKGTHIEDEKLDLLEILKVVSKFDAESDTFTGLPEQIDTDLKH